MPYTMNLYADGGYRRNHETGPIAAAAVVMTNKYERRTAWTYRLPSSPTPTSQRAELCAVILALEQAQSKAQQINSQTNMNITIHTDSKYVIGCMTEWCWKWMRNGFKNYRRREVVNRDLIEKALLLERKVLDAGTVDWVWVPRSQNEVADAVVNGVLDEMEPDYVGSDSDSPIRSIWEKVNW